MAPSPLRSGDPGRLGPYRVVARLGEGGMGAVFLAESAEGRRVAVKVIRPELASDPGFRARFRSEVKRVRQVPPFCTAEVLDADAEHETPYLVVELVDGPSLADAVQERGPLTGGNLHSVAIGVTTALAAIHDAGVVHRDLKPANVLFAPLGTPKVIDFGIATAAGATDHHTTAGQFFGTIAYMSPERLDSTVTAPAGTAADIFAWGAVVTFAATGHTPFPAETLVANAAGLPLPAPDLTGVPHALRDLVARALAEDPADRPSAHELLEKLLKTGDPLINAGLAQRPDLKRAAAAVRHTEGLELSASTTVPAGPSVARGTTAPARPSPERDTTAPVRPWALRGTTAPARPWAPRGTTAPAGPSVPRGTTAPASPSAPRGITAPAGPSAARRPPRRTVVAVAVAALLAGFGAYPATHRLVAGPAGSAAPEAQSLPTARGSEDPASRAGRDGSCTLDGQAEVTARTPHALTCPAAHRPADQSIRARIQLGAADACAAVWTHVNAGRDAYRTTVCAGHVTVALDTDGRTRPVASAVLDRPAPTAWHDLEITTRGAGITVSLDGETAIARTRLAPQLPRGGVILGIGGPGRVSFADVTVAPAP